MNESAAHSPPTDHDKTFVFVWLALVVLTGVTVGVSRLQLGNLSTSVAVAIASIKCCFVLWYFMHLKYDKPILRWMFLVTVLSYAVFLIITLCDYLTR